MASRKAETIRIRLTARSLQISIPCISSNSSLTTIRGEGIVLAGRTADPRNQKPSKATADDRLRI